MRLLQDPSLLESMIRAELRLGPADSAVVDVIDEVQKIHILPDEFHRVIEEHGWSFLLTVSSVRKLNEFTLLRG